MYRKDKKYDLVIVIDYNLKKPIPFKGSAIFIHLTENYKPTAGCIALGKNDMLVLLKIINKKNLCEKNHLFIIHRERKSKDNLNDLNILISKTYGRSKLIFGTLI